MSYTIKNSYTKHPIGRPILGDSKWSIFICEQCGVSFWHRTWWKGKGKKFCSRECTGKWRSIHMVKGKAVNWKSIETHCQAPDCKKVFWKRINSVRRFCSGTCSYKWSGHLVAVRRKKKNGVRRMPLFNFWKEKIGFCEEFRWHPLNKQWLQVKCTYCGKWYVPKISSLWARYQALNRSIGKGAAESRLYCSSECKKACPIYHQREFPKGFREGTSREVQPELRQLVFERDNWTCQKCGGREGSLHCHHIEGIRWNPLESADVDQCITVCSDCHTIIHSKEGCRNIDLRCIPFEKDSDLYIFKL